MNRLTTLNDKQRNFLELMGCDIEDVLADRVADWRYKERLVRHSHLHPSTRGNTELQRMGGWQ